MRKSESKKVDYSGCCVSPWPGVSCGHAKNESDVSPTNLQKANI